MLTEFLQITKESEDMEQAAGTRREHDSIGELEIPRGAYYGVQSLRAKRNFP